MGRFIKTTKPVLSGLEKVAILLAEIGPSFNSNYDRLFEALHLSDDEMKKIRKAMKKLGTYAPSKVHYEIGMEQINREQTVLMETLDFGKRLGIFTEETKTDTSNGVQNLVNQNPEYIANVLRNWLKDS